MAQGAGRMQIQQIKIQKRSEAYRFGFRLSDADSDSGSDWDWGWGSHRVHIVCQMQTEIRILKLFACVRFGKQEP